tara:strand:+ start:274 stop:474 length:201 start_codon:yes stop_codon:yes gene_type:complete
MKKQNDPFGFNKAINWSKLNDPKILRELEKIFENEDKEKIDDDFIQHQIDTQGKIGIEETEPFKNK